MCSAIRFCLSVYFDLSPRGMITPPGTRHCDRDLSLEGEQAIRMPILRTQWPIASGSRTETTATSVQSARSSSGEFRLAQAIAVAAVAQTAAWYPLARA